MQGALFSLHNGTCVKRNKWYCVGWEKKHISIYKEREMKVLSKHLTAKHTQYHGLSHSILPSRTFE